MLALGLLAVGIGSVPLLRWSFSASIEEGLLQQSQSTLVSQLFDARDTPNGIVFEQKSEPISTAYFVAIYDNDSEGTKLISGGGSTSSARGSMPQFPENYRLSQAQENFGAVFDVPSSTGGSPFRGTVTIVQIQGTSKFFTQFVAVSTGNVERYTASYLAIFGVLASITILGGAFLTRWVVTLAFRRLGQVESTAMAIAAGDFSQRLTEVEPPSTEVGRLKRAINTMLGRLDAAIAERDASVRQMRRFVGDASHELRTPLVTVRGYAELYRIGAIAEPEATAQAMERIEKEAIRMSGLVEDLLALARLDERRPMEITEIDLRPIARDAAMDVRATSPDRIITVIDTTADRLPEQQTTAPLDQPATTTTTKPRRGVTLPSARTGGLSLLRRRQKPTSSTPSGAVAPPSSAMPSSVVPPSTVTPAPAPTPTPDHATHTDGPVPIVLGDDNRIRQVVTNLLGNARRFTSDDSPIDIGIGVDSAKRMGWIAVVDHGDGIPEQIREQIFQRFWRADTSRTRETGGSGLGLAIVASIVDSLSGSVDVTETPGGGATFRVSFPLASAPEQRRNVDLQTQPITDLGELTD